LGTGYTTVFQNFTNWTAAGVFERAYAAVLRLERRPLRRNVRVECIDSAYVKSIYGRDCIGRNPTDRGRNATKVSAIVASDGVPVALALFPGNTSDQRTVEVTLRARLTPRAALGMPMYEDKG